MEARDDAARRGGEPRRGTGAHHFYARGLTHAVAIARPCAGGSCPPARGPSDILRMQCASGWRRTGDC
eukprot:6197158-Pleurochrysis_carterae.AAC.1